ncbi:hypothetical protein ACAG96_05130 [Candidatus Izemoplasma sp. B36]|uniref:hypothetical protein n=1 Tax=Candidatus Izemoplasma sp. B36 TaxID=3242468 RepID=UPI003555F6A1
MFKFIKKLIIVFVVILVVLGIVVTVFLGRIKYEVTSNDLPQDVYDTSGDLLTFAKTKTLNLLLAEEDEKYTLVEEIFNLILLDSIRENINQDYDPLGDCTTSACLNVAAEDNFYVDYIFAEINDDNQIVITISGGFQFLFKGDTALIMVFDIDFDLLSLNPSVIFTLSSYQLGNMNLSMSILDNIFNRMNKDDLEDSISFGELNLDDYTYTLSINDAIE